MSGAAVVGGAVVGGLGLGGVGMGGFLALESPVEYKRTVRVKAAQNRDDICTDVFIAAE